MILTKHFYFVRHGQTSAHIDKLICGGGWDIPMTAEGLFHAQTAAEQCQDRIADIERIVSSPLRRIAQTAACFSEKLGIKVEYNSLIAEWAMGDWDRVPYTEVPDLFEGRNDPPNGESRRMFRDRIEAALADILSVNKIPLIVSHSAVWDAIARGLQLSETHIPTCNPARVSYGGIRNTVSLLL